MRSLVRPLLILPALWIAVSTAVHADDPVTIEAGKNKLTLAFPAFPDLPKQAGGDEQLKAWWFGKIDASEVLVEVRIFPGKEYYLQEPEDVADYSIYTYRDAESGGDPAFAFQSRELIRGKYGWIPRAALCAGLLPSAANPVGEVLLLGGMLEEYGYVISFECKPALGEKSRKQVLDFLRKGVTAESAVQDPKWSKAEVEAAFQIFCPEKKARKKCKKPIRTKHFIVFTNASAGKLFAKKMETFYKQIQKVFPFPEVEGKRLLPVYLYRLPEEYYAFCKRVPEWSYHEAMATKGHAWRDYYATYYESPNDPVHAHEATHQLFSNRIHLGGGGSWFQEGVAEYICTKPGERKAYAKGAARRNTYLPFDQMVSSRQLASATGDANAAYLQAASVIEFLRDGKFHPEKFPTFVQRMGLAPDANEAAAEQIIQEIYGVDLAGLEAKWRTYWKGR